MAQLEGTQWELWRKRRRIQQRFGIVSACLFIFAVLALFDGVQMLVRSSNDEISLLAGETDGVSGPCPFQNPVASDLIATFSSKDAPLRFELEGFFAGYLIGSGMWRGRVLCEPHAPTGTYTLEIRFRAMPNAGQRFTLLVYANEADMRAASASFLIVLIGINPFQCAGIVGFFALCIGIIVYRLGTANMALLHTLGASEIFRTSPRGHNPMYAWCSQVSLPGSNIGHEMKVFSPQGREITRARVAKREKNVLCLTADPHPGLCSGCLVKKAESEE